ncbi:copper chaperone PCu(A)C [Thaumasiovibrio subtropicus]|uniref:copper chaperone PCu(A)C n=1 Tax=Thaumasiovibrio subtropicus TaxID=1891207 RepID=UPI000B34CD07|nr:copper chaperone PCu(A)C [Thaumasiovibrio subtropicus]
MKKTLLLSLSLLFSGLVNAQDVDVGDLHIQKPWSKLVPPTSAVTAGFFDVTNEGEADDRIIAARADIAGKVELHNHIHEDGMMKMREVSSIEVPAGETVSLKPGSFHVMFFNLTKVPALGEQFPVIVTFEKAGEVELMFKVKEAIKPMHHNGKHDHNAHDGEHHHH